MPMSTGALVEPISARSSVIDPSVEAFACGTAALVLKRDAAAVQVRGNDAAALIEALDRADDTPWQDRIAETTVDVLMSKLDALGLVSSSESGQPAIAMLSARLGKTPRLVMTHSFFRPDLVHVIGLSDEHARRVVRIGAARSWIGPAIGAPGVPCWHCFVERLAANDDIWALARRGTLRCLSRFGGEAVIGARAADFVAKALLSLYDDGTLLIIDHATGRCRRHGIRALPDCGCTTRRSVAPCASSRSADLLDRVRAAAGGAIDEVTGAVSRAHELDRRPDDPLHVAVARFADPSGRLGKFVVGDAGLRASGLPSRSAFGAAATARDAAAKAMLEALERHCAVARGDEPIHYASAATLGDAAVDCGSGASILDRTAIRAWLPARRLSGGVRYVPASAVLAGWDGDPRESAYTSNGTAIAFDRDDAVVRGFLELVERDATTIWWYNRIARPTLDLASFADVFADRFGANLASRGWSLTVFDLTGDLGVPVLAAMASDGSRAAPVFGFAARFDVRDALTGALCELGQALRFADQEQAKWDGFDWSTQPHLIFRPGHMRADEFEPAQTAGIATCAAIAQRAKLDILICELDRADVGLPVCKVIAPPLLPPGRPRVCARLLETPVRLGWRSRPCAPDALNPQTLPM